MKIEILNEFFLQEHHLQRLGLLGRFEVAIDTDSEAKAIDRLQDVDIALGDCFVTPFNRRVFESAQKLKLLVLNSTGYDGVDLSAANEKGIRVANTPNFSTDAVAEMAIGLMFAVNRRLVMADRANRRSPFEIDPGNIDHEKFWGTNLRGKTLGVLGLGAIGTRVSEIGRALGMETIAYNRSPKKIEGVDLVKFEELFRRSDVLSIHLALNHETEGIVSRKELNLMKPSAILINTGRGKHVVTADLLVALSDERISGAGLDVVDGVGKGHRLLSLENVVITPHIGSSTNESWKVNLPDTAVSTVEAFIKGAPINLVN